MLQLLARLGFETHRRFPRAQFSFRPDVVSQDRHLALVALSLDLPPDHHGIPDPGGEQFVHLRFVRIQFAAA